MNGILECKQVLREFEVPPTEEGIASILIALMASLREASLDEASCFSVELSVQEALVNALVHGVLENGGRRIRLTCEIDDTRVRVTVQDDGPGFDWAGACAAQPEGRMSRMNSGGRGLLLVHAMMSRVLFNHSGNCITMEMDLPRSSRLPVVPIEDWNRASYPGQNVRPGR